KWHESVLAAAFPDSGEWIFMSAAEVLRRFNANEQVNGLPISFTKPSDVDLVTSNMAAILAPGGGINDVVRSIPFMWCTIGNANYSCQVFVPDESAQFASSRSLAAESGSTNPSGPQRTPAFTLIPSKQFPTNDRGEDCRLLDEDCTSVGVKNVLVLGAGLALTLDPDLLKPLGEGIGVGNIIQFATYNGTWSFGSGLGLSDGFTLVYPTSCTVTLPDAAVCTDPSLSVASIN
ncbi:MAG: hypothetical protein ACR2PV_08670, partial [Gammaproteobacteria bacterium]